MDPKVLADWSAAAFRRFCEKHGLDPATVQVVGVFTHTWARGDEALPLPAEVKTEQDLGGRAAADKGG